MPKRTWKYHGSVLDHPPVQQLIIFLEKDREEIKRLTKRRIKLVTEDPHAYDYYNKCFVCRGKHHGHHGRGGCPWFRKAPEGAVPRPQYDVACSGCGRIGVTCCQEGSHVVKKRCGFCGSAGHWFWEDKCRDGRGASPSVRNVWNSMKKAFMEEESEEGDNMEVVVDNKDKELEDVDSLMLQSKEEDNKEVVGDDEDKELEVVGRHFKELTT